MKSIMGNDMRTFKAAVCAAMACAVTAAFAGNVRVTDSVNAGARSARVPQGAEAFEVEDRKSVV